MGTDLTTKESELMAIETALVKGDLSLLTTEQRIIHVKNVCESLGINPLTRPFDYISYQGKLVLYANKDCASQLRKKDNVSLEVKSTVLTDNIYTVTVSARSGCRTDEEIGVLDVTGLKGTALANAMMKTLTKAKRRATLSICGLGFPDESEVVEEREVVGCEVLEKKLDSLEVKTEGVQIPIQRKLLLKIMDLTSQGKDVANLEWLKNAYEFKSSGELLKMSDEKAMDLYSEVKDLSAEQVKSLIKE